MRYSGNKHRSTYLEHALRAIAVTGSLESTEPKLLCCVSAAIDVAVRQGDADRRKRREARSAFLSWQSGRRKSAMIA